jgi:hypothetical protein
VHLTKAPSQNSPAIRRLANRARVDDMLIAGGIYDRTIATPKALLLLCFISIRERV